MITLSRREYKKALADHNKAIALKPNFAGGYFDRGTAYSEMGDYEKAIVDYTKTIDLASDYAEAYTNRYCLHCES